MTLGAFLLLLLLTVKHFVADGPMQNPYMYKNKGEYGHFGGILHAGIHAAFTFVIFEGIMGNVVASALAACADFIVHYHVDWLKVRTTKKYGWSRMQKEMVTTFAFHWNGERLRVNTWSENVFDGDAWRRPNPPWQEQRVKVGIPGLLITSDYYFYALIADQCAHFATYVALVWIFAQ